MKAPWHKIAIAIFFMLFTAGSVGAGDAGRESQFSIGSGVRALGMGGGFVGLADDASAIYWNQAALTLLDNQEINLMHVTLYEGSVYDVASFVYPHPKLGGFGVSFMRLGTGDIMRREDWNEVGEFSYATWQLILGYGHKLEKGFSFGTGLKIVNQTLDRNSTYGVGLDISFYSRIIKNISAGISFQDIIAPRLRLGSALEITPMTVVAGIGAKDVRLGSGFRHNIGLGLEKGENRSVKLHLGAESIYRDYLSLRAGYDRDNLTFGLGIIYQKLRFDYAYKFMDGLSDSHRLGLSIRLGTSVSEKIRREKEFESARGSSLILEDRKRSFRLFKELADKYYHNNSLDSAYAYYQRALAFNEDDRDTRHRVNQIDELRKSALAEKEIKARPQADMTQQLLDGYYSQAELFFNKGSFAAALDIIDLGLGRSPDDQKFLALRDQVTAGRDLEIGRMMDEASRADRDGRYADALTAYNRVMELSPGNVEVKQLIAKDGTELNKLQLINKGAELFASGLYSDAKGRFDEVLKIDPQNKVARDYEGRIALLMKESTELQDLQKDERVWKIYLSALEYFRKEDYANAIKLWEEVLKYYPGNKNTMNNIEQARLRLQNK